MKKAIAEFIKLMEEDAEFAVQVLKQEKKEDIVRLAAEKEIELSVDDIDEINEVIREKSLEKLDTSTAAGQLVKKTFEDNDFAEKILAEAEEEKVIEIAEEQGLSLTGKDIEEANEMLAEIAGVSASKEPDDELSEEELEQVAGGGTPAIPVAATVGTAIAAGITAVSYLEFRALKKEKERHENNN